MELVGAFEEHLETNLARHRRFLADRRRLGRGPLVAVLAAGVERGEDFLEPVGGEIVVDLLEIAHDPRLGDLLFREFVEDREHTERLRHDPLLGFLEPVGRKVMRRQPQPEAFGAVEPRPGQRKELRQPPAQPRQVTPTADVGEQPDGGLGHRQHGALGGDAVTARAGDPDAAAHRHPVHERHPRLGVGIFKVVEAIFVEEEGPRRGFGALDTVGDIDHVAAGAKSSAFGVIEQDDPHIGIVAPLDQGARHVTDHTPVEAVQRLGPVEPQPSGTPFLDRQNISRNVRHRVHHFIIA